MEISEREHHIKTLENLLSHYKAREKCEGYYDSTLKDNVEALHYAISSLKTDEVYQLMYEGEEIYTKADMVAMLEELQLEIEELDTPNNGSAYMDCAEIIQQKINALKINQSDYRTACEGLKMLTEALWNNQKEKKNGNED